MRRPFGENASPPAFDGRSTDFTSPLALRTKACLPADHATAPSGPSATRAIQRARGAIASVSASPAASVPTTLPSSPLVTMRLPSETAARMPPACTCTRCTLRSAATNSSVSSPSANTARSFRKFTATTGAPAASGFTRSVIDGMLFCVSDTGSVRRDRALEALADLLLGQVAPDEHDPALALLVRAPFALMIAVEHHVHALEHEALRVVLEREDALGAQDVRPLGLCEVLDERKELVGIE